MLDKLKKLYNKYLPLFLNREIITYAVAGVLTTLVNLGVYRLFRKAFLMEAYTANAIAWIAAVSFAYIVNNFWVFRQRWVNFLDEFYKVVKFFAARMLSLIVEMLGLYIFYTVMNINDMIVKVFMAIVVIILNYLLSKFFIFKK